jgi:PEP-CTERM motif
VTGLSEDIGMTKTRVVTGILGAVFFLTLVTSVRADKIQVDLFLEKAIYAERHNTAVLDIQRAETGYLYAGHFENNNGKHLGFSNSGKHVGFSIVAFKPGPRLGLVRPQAPSVSENPEPTAMILLGTGLAAVAGLARKKSRKRA